MKTKSIIIWAEGGGQIGLGHLSRCVALAEKMRNADLPVSFVVNDSLSAVRWISDHGFKYRVADMNADNNVYDTKDAVVLIDTKKPVQTLLKSLKQNGCVTVLMDNVTTARLQADLVIYPTATLTNGLRWDGFRGKLYYGPEYILLRKSYLEARKDPPRQSANPPYHVLVTMGGSDPNRLTRKILSALAGWRQDLRLTAVIGPDFEQDDQIELTRQGEETGIRILRHVSDLAPLLATSYLAVTALGTTIYEAAFLGVPSVVIGNYESDMEDIAGVESLGIGVGLGHFADMNEERLRSVVASLIDDAAQHQTMSNRGKALTDGRGAGRIVDIFRSLIAAGN